MKTKDILQFICENAPEWFFNGLRSIELEEESEVSRICFSLDLPWSDCRGFSCFVDDLKERLYEFIKQNEKEMNNEFIRLAKIIGKKVVIE